MSGSNSVRFSAIFILAAFMTSSATCQAVDGKVPRVAFKLERNRVIIPTSVNGSEPLDLILDTGMGFDGVYLFHEEFADMMDTTGAIAVRVPGAGSGEASTAHMIETGTLRFGDVSVDSQRVIISRSENTQTFPTDGVIGWNLFGHYAVEVDYDRKLIFLHDTAGFTVDSTWSGIPVTMENNLSFFPARLEVVDGEIVPVTMYIDLASGDALELLLGADQKFSLPEKLDTGYLGTGLSGDIHGYRGYSRHLWLGEYMLTEVATAFAPAEVRSKQKGADGILGNDCIRRFNIIFDYTHSRLYLKPNTYFNLPFE